MSHSFPPHTSPGGQPPQRTLELREGTAEFELFIARAELESRNNPGHGLQHLACLLDFDPGRPEWLAMVDAYLEIVGQAADQLLPNTEERYYAHEALRALIWQRQGRTAEAMSLLLQITMAKPDADFLVHWAPSWLEPPGALESLESHTATLVLGSALNSFEEWKHLTVRRQRLLDRFVALGDRYRAHFGLDETSRMILAGLYRKVGRFEQSLAFLRQEASQGDDWHLATAEGLVLREMGRPDEAEAAFRRALTHDPEDRSAYLETADMWLDRGLYARARSWYARVLEAEPEHPWALPSHLFAGWRHGRLEPGYDLDHDHPPHRLMQLDSEGNTRASLLLARLLPYSGYLPESDDATANILRQISAQFAGRPADPNAEGQSIRASVSCIEPPSLRTAFRMELQAIGHGHLRMEVDVQSIPEPDPRLAIDPQGVQLWHFQGTEPSPALAAPATDVLEAVGQLAASPFDRKRNWADASRAADRLAPSRATELLATMVHPPAMPTGLSALAWIPRVQLAAAQIIAHLETGWQGSARRQALYSMLLGPRDWTTGIAAFVLTHLITEEPALCLDIHEAFRRLDAGTPQSGHWGYLEPFYGFWVTLPILLPEERQEIQAKLAALYEEE